MSASLANAPLELRAIGLPLERIEGHAKVTGTAPYAYEHDLTDPLYVHPVQATIARGRIAAIDVDAAKALDGVVAVITHRERAPARLRRKQRAVGAAIWRNRLSRPVHRRGDRGTPGNRAAGGKLGAGPLRRAIA